MLQDGAWEGLGLSGEVQKEVQTLQAAEKIPGELSYDMDSVKESFSELYKQEIKRMEELFPDRFASMNALLRFANQSVPDYSDIFEAQTKWARKKFPGFHAQLSNRSSSEQTQTVYDVELDIVRLETDGIMIYEAVSTSPEGK